MKKFIISIILVLTFVLSTIPALAASETVDLETMSKDELMALVDNVRAALAKQDIAYKNGKIIYDENNIIASIDGFRFDSTGWLYVDMTIINQSDNDIHFMLDNTYINGWKVSTSETTMFNIASKKNAKGAIRFIKVSDEAQITDVAQLETFSFTTAVKNASDYSVLFTGDEENLIFSSNK